ncbi:Alpha/Beta hydrolase protein [Boletus reticuloceps]|uniref:Alpha/Beta hydrolase protein n=1 Tax=Boletus reticuloceps TaxID=495285 RepID=A0A8I3ACA9_9AGAM|nr:Alpha/Beta hydrolase protein [Boletus reticuloceps]
MPLPLSNPVHDQPASSCTRTLLAAFGTIAIFYTSIVVPAGFLLGSAQYIGSLIGFWLVATCTSWFFVLFGTLSARKRGTFVTALRFGLGPLLSLWDSSYAVGHLFYPMNSVPLYPTSISLTAVAWAFIILMVAISYSLDRLYVSVTTELASSGNLSEDTSPGCVGSWLGLPRNSLSSASNDTSEMANEPGNPSWLSSMPITETNTTVTDEEKAHLLSDLELVMSPRTSTIPYTPTAPGWTSVHPRPLRPIRAHPNLDNIQTPPLPSPPRPHVFHTTTTNAVYRLSTHLVPAAYPRLAPDIPPSEIPAYTPGASPADRREKMDRLVKQAVETQTAYEKGRLDGEPSEKLLWNCVNRYTWETMLRSLLNAPAGAMVDEVWAWDAVQHGDAAVVNANNLNGIFDWLDNTRDIANFLLHHLPEHVDATVLPTRLPRLPASVTSVREERGYRTRKLVVVGHSFGGCTSLRVAFDFPKLFSSFVLVDPVIQRPDMYPSEYVYGYVLGALTRRDRWSSREEALQLFQKSSFFSAWNPDVLRLYAEHALIDDAKGGVRLKMSGLQEGISFANRRLPMETWELLERLDAGIPLRWVVPEKPLSSTKELTHERVWRRPANSTNVMFHFANHLIVQEAPCELAHDISDFLLCKYGSIRDCRTSRM